MCIIKIRRDPPEETPVVVPIRPISRGQHQPTTHSSSRVSPRASAPSTPQMSRLQQQQQPRASAGNVSHRRSGSQQQIVIAQPSSPRTSRPKLPVQHRSSYSYGSGPVPTRESVERMQLSSQGQLQPLRRGSSIGQQPGRRSAGSVTFGVANVDPRGSHVSHRSTREKIVIVDEMGRRRESGFH